MKTYFLGISLAIAAIQPLAAQMNSGPVHSGNRQANVVKAAAKPAEGTMYITDQFLPSRIAGQQTTYMLRYDAYHDYFEMSTPGGEPKQLPIQAGDVITHNNKTYVVAEYTTSKEEEEKGYLSLVYDGAKTRIYRRERVYLQAASEAANSYQSSRPAAYKRAGDELYISSNGQRALFFQPGKKGISKIYADKSKQIMEHVKTNKIDLETEDGLKKLGAYLDTI